jgi:hypothetical protein
MHTRGRYSAADLSIVTPNGPRATLEPPVYFNAREVAEWRAIVDRLGAEYFPRECHMLLTCFISISCQLEAISAALSKLKEPPRDEATRKEYWELTRCRGQLVMGLASLSTKLRLAPSTRNDRDRTTVQARRAAQSTGRKPWEFGTDLDS